MNERFQNALQKKSQKTPPIWFMRQAGRYHQHYQNLRKDHSFLELCRNPDLAAEVAMGPILDFDFDVSILFSDILFPLDALGLGLSYSDSKGPALDQNISTETLLKMPSAKIAFNELKFQGEAVKKTRSRLPHNKSLIGFVGGPWTLFVYGTEGGHAGSLIQSKTNLSLYHQFMEILYPLMKLNIQNQLESGAEAVMIFDTAGGELSPSIFEEHLEPYLLRLLSEFPGQLGYYTKFASPEFYSTKMRTASWAGFGFDHRHQITRVLKNSKQLFATDLKSGFIQGNFDQALLFLKPEQFRIALDQYLKPILQLSIDERAGWVCGLGHGVLPKTPEENVRYFIQHIREVCS